MLPSLWRIRCSMGGNFSPARIPATYLRTLLSILRMHDANPQVEVGRVLVGAVARRGQASQSVDVVRAPFGKRHRIRIARDGLKQFAVTLFAFSNVFSAQSLYSWYSGFMANPLRRNCCKVAGIVRRRTFPSLLRASPGPRLGAVSTGLGLRSDGSVPCSRP